jgi:hypothetical protein
MRTPFRAAALLALAAALACRDSTPVAPEPTLSAEAESQVGVQSALKTALLYNLLTGEAVEVPVRNEKEGAKVCETVDALETIADVLIACYILP